MIDTEQLNKDILELWRETPESIRGEHWPVLFPSFKGGTILFIGLNPGDKDKLEKYKIDDLRDLTDVEKINKQIGYEKESKEIYIKYFGEFRKTTQNLKLDDFDHLDLYFYRNGKSKIFLKMLKEKNFKDFGKKQLEISLKFLESINPLVIVVANKNSSEIIKEEFKIEDVAFDVDSEGFDIIELGSKKIPIFFSGMLGYGRLDGNTSKRLVWHIKRAIKWYDRNNEIN